MNRKAAPGPARPVARRKAEAVKVAESGLRDLHEKMAGDGAVEHRGHQAIDDSRKLMKQADQAMAGKRQKMTGAEQSAEFERVAREHGAEGDEEAFDGVMRKLAKPKAR